MMTHLMDLTDNFCVRTHYFTGNGRSYRGSPRQIVALMIDDLDYPDDYPLTISSDRTYGESFPLSWSELQSMAADHRANEVTNA